MKDKILTIDDIDLLVVDFDGVLTDQALIIINLIDDIAEDFNSLPIIYDQNFLVEENSPNDSFVDIWFHK